MRIFLSPIRTVFLCACLCGLSSLMPCSAQQANPPGVVDEAEEKLRSIQFPNTAIPVILLEYEKLTNKQIIRDAAIQDKSLSILTSGKMSRTEAAEFIEKSLLLNGYALIPTENPNQLKIIGFTADKNLSSEGLPILTNPAMLPLSEQIVTYIMPLVYLESEAAAELFTNAIELHSYGKITPLENTSAVIVTESASVIRRLLQIRDHLDVIPLKTINRSFQLERAEADDIADALIELLGLDQESGGGQNPGNTARPGNQANANTPATPGTTVGGTSQTTPNAPQPRVHAISRANRIFVTASPTDMENIEDIISHLDAPIEGSRFMQRKLRYLDVSTFLEISGNVLLRGREAEGGQGELSGGSTNTGGLSSGQGFQNNNTTNTTGSTTGFGSSSGGSTTGDLGNAGTDTAAAPQSIVIDKTLLVADNIQNLLIASGPPEDLALINDLLDSMDVRPEQIQISAIIAQLNLGDNFELGIDFLRSFEPPADGTFFNAGGSFASRTGDSQTLLDVATLTDPANLLPAAQGLTFYGQINRYLDTFISTLASTNRFEVLSRPTVYTINNRQAVIETGQRVAVPRSTLSSIDVGNQIVTSNIDFEDIVLRIAVLPLINSEGEITLQIQQKNDSIIGSQVVGGNAIPTIATQTLGTTVMVEDGNTILLGGLISENEQKTESGLPLFANIPVLGRVFGSTNDAVSRQELLIFLQTKIIRNGHDQFDVDQDLLDRTAVGEVAEEFAVAEDDNIDLFESEDFNSPEKRIHFFRNLFKKKPKHRAVPIQVEPASAPSRP